MPVSPAGLKKKGGDTILQTTLAVATIAYFLSKEIRLWYQLLKKK